MAADYVQEQIIQAGAADFSSEAAEKAVIARMLARSTDAEAHAGELTEKDFYYPQYGKIFRAIQTVVTQRMHVDLITVDAALGKLFPGEAGTLAETMVGAAGMIAATGRRIEDYIKIVKDLSTRRQSIRSFEGLVAQLRDPTRNIADIIDEMRAQSGQIVQSRHQWTTVQDVILATYEYLEKRQSGQIKSITTGIGNIDGLIGGFFGGELTVIGARPSVGKSAFGANIAMSAARKGFKVAVVSREMTDIQYGARMISHEAWVDGMKLRKGEINPDDWSRIAECMGDIGALPIEFLFSVRTVENLAQEVQRKVERGELDMLIVDYLQLMETRRQFRQENLRVGYISTTLKHLATDCNIPVIALAQVNRDTDGQMPSLKSLKASGDIEQDADGVIFLHRPASASDNFIDRRDRDYFDSYTEKGLVYLCIGVAKQRQGAVGNACVLFDPAYMRYIEIDRTGEGPTETKEA